MTATHADNQIHADARDLPPSGRVGARFGGVLVTRSLFDHAVIGRLSDEAEAARDDADFQETLIDDLADQRGGQPARRLWSVQGGPVQDAAYAAEAVIRKLSALTGRAVEPSGGRGSYSYYLGDRHFLGLHRDIPTCDLSVITVLYDDSDPHDPRGGLLYYPDRCDELLSTIRERPRDGARVAKPRPGDAIIIAGGEVTHRVLPTAPDATRVISVLCYRVLESG